MFFSVVYLRLVPEFFSFILFVQTRLSGHMLHTPTVSNKILFLQGRSCTNTSYTVDSAPFSLALSNKVSLQAIHRRWGASVVSENG